MAKSTTIENRFLSKLRRDPATGCLLWVAATGSHGYGVFYVDRGVYTLAHVHAWERIHGPVPAGMCVLHRCDVLHEDPLGSRRCCEVSHLWLGTRNDNNADMGRKGRQRTPRGPQNGNFKISDHDADLIRRAAQQGESSRSVARRFSVSHTHVLRLTKHKRGSCSTNR